MLVFGLVLGQQEPEELSHKAGPQAKNKTKQKAEAGLQEK